MLVLKYLFKNKNETLTQNKEINFGKSLYRVPPGNKDKNYRVFLFVLPVTIQIPFISVVRVHVLGKKESLSLELLKACRFFLEECT